MTVPRNDSDGSSNDTERWLQRQESAQRKGSFFILVVGAAILVSIGGWALYEGWILFGVAHSGLYTTAVRAASKNPTIIKSLGEPIDTGMFDISGDFENEKGVSSSDMFLRLHGPKGEGRLQVVGVQAGSHPPFYKKLYFIGNNGVVADLTH